MNIDLNYFPKRNIRFYLTSYLKKVTLFDLLGLNKKKHKFFIKQDHMLQLNKQVLLRNTIKQRTIEYLKFNSALKNYKNFRNILGYPSRGQRTHTNAKTKKKLKH